MTVGGPSQLFNFRMFLLRDRLPSLTQPRIPVYDGISDLRCGMGMDRDVLHVPAMIPHNIRSTTTPARIVTGIDICRF